MRVSAKYKEGGGITVVVYEEGTEVRIGVVDNVEGIAPEHIGHVFNNFYQATKERQGAGLGLFIARTIVEARAGEIGVHSAGLGKGAVFYFSLPKVRPNLPAWSKVGKKLSEQMLPGTMVALLSTVFCLSTVFAVPTISSVSGTFSDGASVTIAGNAFGDNGPNIVLFDDFENGVSGGVIRTDADSATVGNWNAVSGNPKYCDQECISGTLCFRADQSLSWVEYAEAMIPGGSIDVFASWWLKIPLGDKVPGDGTADTRNWKQLWLMGSSTTDDDIVLPTFLPGAYYINGNNSPFGAYPNVDFSIGTWTRLSAWVHGASDTTGNVTLIQTSSQGTVERTNKNSAVLFPGGIFERIRLNGYGRVTTDSHPMFDDFYFAAGPYARARVEIGNASTYNASTNLAIMTIDDWSDSSITAIARKGSFADGDSAYLYVFNANGDSNTAGFPIVLGGGDRLLASPKRPTGFRLY